MIKSKEEILKVLEEYVKVYYEWVYQLYMPNCKEWTNEKMVMYSNGVVFGKFRESDSSIMKILKEGIADDLLSKEIDVNIKYQIAKYKKVEQLDIMDERKYKLEQEKLNDLKKYPIDDWIQKYFGWIIEKFIGVSYSEGRVLIYLHHALENYYIQQHHPYNNNLEQLEKAYATVLDKHSQFYKYGIITVENDERCKRQVLSSKKWQLISSIFWQLSTSILYTPTDCSVGIFLLKRKFHFFHSL